MSELIELESQNSEVNADVDVGLFIETIQHYEFIFNKGHKDYKNKVMKDAAWKEIAEIFNGSVEELMRLWKNLRDRFLKEKSKCKSGSEAPESVWPFYKLMMFYTKFTKPRKTYTVGGISKPSSRANSYERPSSSLSSWSAIESDTLFSPGSGMSEGENVSGVDVPSTSAASSQPTVETPKAQPGQRKKRKTVEGQDQVAELINIAKELAQRVPEGTSINAKFAEYVAASLEEMTKEEAKEKRKKIMDILNQ